MEVTLIRGVLHWARSFVVVVPLAGSLLLACSGSGQKDAEVPTGDTSGGATETSTEDTGGSQPSTSPPAQVESGGLNATQREMMEIVLKRGGKKAEQCAVSVPDGKGGEGEVQVLFDGQKGRVTDVTVGPPWAGTSMESCIKRSFIGEIVVPFDGDPLEVPYPVKIPVKAAAVDPKKPGKK